MTQQSVYYVKCSPETLCKNVADLINHSLDKKMDPQKQTLIKINGNYDRYYPGSNSSPWFIDALLKSLCDYGFKNLIICEGDLPQFKARDMIVKTKLKPILDKYGVSFVDYENYERDDKEIPWIFRESQLINNPVPHGHGIAKISCACKNLFGVLPVTRRKYHSILSEKLIELVSELPMFTIVDGTVGLDGESTRRGNPRLMNFSLAGYDPYSIDVVVGRILGFPPEQIPLLAEAHKRVLVDYDVILKGDITDINQLPSHPFPYQLSKMRRFSMTLEETRLEQNKIFLWLLHRVIRINHLITFMRKKSTLYSGEWMEYAKFMTSTE